MTDHPLLRARLTIPTRADLLIKQAEQSADKHSQFAEARLAFETGALRGTVRSLCAELDAYKPHINPELTYINGALDKGLPVMLGVEGHGEDVAVVEVWCNGLNIEWHLHQDALDSLHRQAIATDAEMREDMRIESRIDSRRAA